MIDLQDRHFASLDRAQPLHLTIAAQISERIAGGELAPGDRLPSEHELAQSFSVSRNVVREAIACLRSDGLIGSRQGMGAFVLDPKSRQALRIHSEALDDRKKLRGLFELRGLLEIGAASFAATRRSQTQLVRIQDSLSKLEGRDCLTDEGIDDDLEFHRRIAEAAGNDYLVEFLEFIGQRVRQSILAARDRRDVAAILRITNKEHRVIYEAIAASDPHAAGNAMRDHIEGAAGRLDLAL